MNEEISRAIEHLNNGGIILYPLIQYGELVVMQQIKKQSIKFMISKKKANIASYMFDE